MSLSAQFRGRNEGGLESGPSTSGKLQVILGSHPSSVQRTLHSSTAVWSLSSHIDAGILIWRALRCACSNSCLYLLGPQTQQVSQPWLHRLIHEQSWNNPFTGSINPNSVSLLRIMYPNVCCCGCTHINPHRKTYIASVHFGHKMDKKKQNEHTNVWTKSLQTQFIS